MMYDMAMYVIEDIDDAIRAEEHEIYSFIIDEEECTNCGLVLGPHDRTFFPCVVVVGLGEEDAWPLCLDCAGPLLAPKEWIVVLDP